MSYILEALKKAEQKREQEEQTKIPAFSREPAPDRKKRILWPYLLAAALLLNAGLMYLWTGSSRSTRSEGPAEASGTRPSVPAPAPVSAPVDGVPGEHAVPKADSVSPQSSALTHPTPAPPVQTERIEQGRAGDIKGVAQPKDTGRGIGHIPAKEMREAKAAPVVKAPAPPRPVLDARARAELRPIAGKIYTLNELPASIKGVLPEFRISGHAYSPEPQTRVTRVNDKILQEGQDLAPGLKVVEIIPGGIIMGFEGFRFRVLTNENR